MTDDALSALSRRAGAIVIDPSNAGLAPKRSPSLVRAVVLARHWANELAEGKAASVREIARRHGLCHLYVGKLMPLAFLAPNLVEDILDGRQLRGLSIATLTTDALPLTWREQRTRIRGDA